MKKILLCVSLCALPFGAPAQVRETPAPAAARAAKAIPAGEVVVVLGEQTFNALLEAVFALPKPPSYPLARGGGRGSCAGELVLAREAEGVRTSVRLRDGRINAPLAFRGTYGAPVLGCLNFQGWADTDLSLSFDQQRQTLLARVEVKQVNLRGVPSLVEQGVTGLVQDALDARVNPVEILRADQLSTSFSLSKAGSGGALRLRAREVRHEIAPGELRLRVAYEFVREE